MAAWRSSRALSFARSLCGCAKIAEAESLDADAAEQTHAVGEMLADRWGCPARGKTPPSALPDDTRLPLARTARHVARVAHLSEPPRTCPFACLEHADPHTIRVMRAVSRAGETLRIPVADSLPGGMTAADDQAIDTWLAAYHAAQASDDAARERERAERSKP